jgi:hypothetical protein
MPLDTHWVSAVGWFEWLEIRGTSRSSSFPALDLAFPMLQG